jgi:hypothetical protein
MTNNQEALESFNELYELSGKYDYDQYDVSDLVKKIRAALSGETPPAEEPVASKTPPLDIELVADIKARDEERARLLAAYQGSGSGFGAYQEYLTAAIASSEDVRKLLLMLDYGADNTVGRGTVYQEVTQAGLMYEIFKLVGEYGTPMVVAEEYYVSIYAQTSDELDTDGYYPVYEGEFAPERVTSILKLAKALHVNLRYDVNFLDDAGERAYPIFAIHS